MIRTISSTSNLVAPRYVLAALLCCSATACSAAADDGADSNAGAATARDPKTGQYVGAGGATIFDAPACAAKPLSQAEIGKLVVPGQAMSSLGAYKAEFRRRAVAASGKGPWEQVTDGNMYLGFPRFPSPDVVALLKEGEVFVALDAQGPTVKWGKEEVWDSRGRGKPGLVWCPVSTTGEVACDAERPEGPRSTGNKISFFSAEKLVTKVEARVGKTCAWIHGTSEVKAGFEEEFAFVVNFDK